jgi:sulfoxide reductase heme-binding subunit YedZ
VVRAIGQASSRANGVTGKSTVRLLKVIIWVGALAPLGYLLYQFFILKDFGANPIEQITHWTGRSALTILMVTLAITPIRRFSGWNPVIQLRRPLGLFAFFYALLHFLTYGILDLWFDFSRIGEDIVKRPYITVGFTAFVLMIPLAITSTKGWIRRMGKRWTLLHRLIYVSAALGVLHYFWKVKADTRWPVIFAGILALLMLARLRFSRPARPLRTPAEAPRPTGAT